jgi:hypothetical protein
MNLAIGEKDFIRMFRLKNSGLPDLAQELFRKYNLEYRLSSTEELEKYVLSFLKLEETARLARSREENQRVFECGWRENLEELRVATPKSFEAALKPKYYRGSKFFRYDNKLVITDNFQLEYELFVIARLCLSHQYLQNVETICEFGSGSCANLLLLSKVLPNAKLIGLDWTVASCEIARELGIKLSKPISAHMFDMLAPDFSVRIPEGSAVISIHAFEQLGNEFEQALEFILQARPSIVVQYEPALEFYDENRLLDYLALWYSRRRGYLQGYYSRLRQLERDGRIRIVDSYRPYLGGVFHESSVLVWKPV